MSNYKKILVFAGVVLATGVAFAGQAPVAVSPGDPDKLVLVEARCPTFSWAAVDGAESYELIVYQVGEQAENAEPVLQQTLPGAVSAWTPSLDRCLGRTGRYAWSIRAAGPEGLTEWSMASLFQVAPAPTEFALEQALEFVRGHLAAEAERAGLGKAGASEKREAGAVTAEGGSQDLVTLAAIAPAASVDLLVTDGDIAVTSVNAAFQHAYIQLDTITGGRPPAFDCNQPSEYGRLLYRYDGEFFYICSDDGWRDFNCASPPC